MDIKENSGGDNILDATGYSSNYPNPKYDTEKNSGNPYNDEVDVVSVRMYQNPMSSSTLYTFSGTYTKKETGTTGFDINSEESVAGVSDYNTYRYEFINQILGYTVSSLTKSLSSTSILPVVDHEIGEINQSVSASKDDIIQFKVNEFETYQLEMSEKASGNYKVFVNPDPDKLDSYVRESKGLANKLSSENVNDVPVTVTFNTPLSPNELEQIFGGLDFAPTEFYGRGVNGEDRYTYGGMIESISDINEITNDCTRAEDYDVKGTIAIYGTIDSDDIESLQNNSEVYLADVTGYIAKEKAIESLNTKSSAPIKVQTHNLYWYIEDLSAL
ncbi:MAG TPA: hypothetical protein VM577_03820 [Anaerovoracaceae bacterium]|nr:hypothetical protein [Anaerovoracaceae bacterium]